ncbi:MAG: DUF5668 domain-containing protein [Anaerolineae bacterium]|nr:DUF5668 domain-containing protein [Anaerolineae bacterium]
MSERRGRGYRGPGLFWPLVLIGVGVIFLLVNLGYLQAGNVWAVLWRFWPALLILAGIDILFGSRSTVGAVISALLGLALIVAIIALIWLAPQIPALRTLTASAELRTERVSQPLEGVTEARVVMDVGSAEVTLYDLEESASLIEADVSHSGELRFDVSKRGSRAEVRLDVRRSAPLSWFSGQRERWNVGLSREVLYEIELDAGSGTCDLDLSGLRVADFRLDLGSGETRLKLPASGDMSCSMDLGSGGLDITLPEGMAARVELDKGSGDFRPGPRFQLVRGKERGDGVWETAGYATAANRVSMEIDMGSGLVSIH